MTALRKYVAVALCAICPSSLGWAQQSIALIPPNAPSILRPYLAPQAPPARLANSPRLRELVRAGTLYLTVQDAIALALENNIDIEVARYNPLISDWNVTRAEAGGALPGVPSNAAQAGAVAAGQGVEGSQQAAGVTAPGTGTSRVQSTNATISQIGPVTPTLDPIIQESSTFSHTTALYPDAQASATATLVDGTRAHTLSIQQGFLTGGSATLTYTDHYLDQNSPNDVLNPTSAPLLSIAAQQYLLNGAGVAVNARFINVAKMNRDSSNLAFQNTVIGIVAQVLNAYYTLEADYEDIKAKRSASETAVTFLSNVKEQVRIGSLAPSETINAESQAITNQQALSDSEVALKQQEIQLKNLLSRNGTADPILAGVSCPSIQSRSRTRITFPHWKNWSDRPSPTVPTWSASGKLKPLLCSVIWEPKMESCPLRSLAATRAKPASPGPPERWSSTARPWYPTHISWAASARRWVRSYAVISPPRASSVHMKCPSATGRPEPTMPLIS